MNWVKDLEERYGSTAAGAGAGGGGAIEPGGGAFETDGVGGKEIAVIGVSFSDSFLKQERSVMQIVIRVADDRPAERVEQIVQQIEGLLQQDAMSIEIKNKSPRKVFA